MYTRRQRARNIANRRNVQLKVSCSQEMDVLKILTIVSTRYRFKFEYCTFVKVDRLRKNICPRPTQGASRGSEWLGLHVYVYVFKYSEYVQTSNSLSAAVWVVANSLHTTRRDATRLSRRVVSGWALARYELWALTTTCWDYDWRHPRAVCVANRRLAAPAPYDP